MSEEDKAFPGLYFESMKLGLRENIEYTMHMLRTTFDRDMRIALLQQIITFLNTRVEDASERIDINELEPDYDEVVAIVKTEQGYEADEDISPVIHGTKIYTVAKGKRKIMYERNLLKALEKMMIVLVDSGVLDLNEQMEMSMPVSMTSGKRM